MTEPLQSTNEPEVPEQKVVPFANYVAAKRMGIPVDQYPPLQGANEVKRFPTVPVLIALVLVGVLYGVLEYTVAQSNSAPTEGNTTTGSSHGTRHAKLMGNQTTPADVGGGFRPAAEGGDATKADTAHLAKAANLEAPAEATNAFGALSNVNKGAPHFAAPAQFLNATQYIDRSENRKAEEIVDGVLRLGDYVTVLAAVGGWKALYFLVYEPDDMLRLSRYYPEEFVKASPPPLKLTVRGKNAGKFQVVLLGAQKEIPDIQAQIFLMNSTTGEQRRDRSSLLAKLVTGLKKSDPGNEFTIKQLDSITYIP